MKFNHQTLHATIDLETLSRKPNAAIIAIGLVLFTEHRIVDKIQILIDPTNYAYSGFGDSCNTNGEYGHIEQETLTWWDEQDPEVKMAMFSGKETPLSAAVQLTNFLSSYHPQKIETWTNPPSFDITILQSMFDSRGVEFPFNFQRQNSLKTIEKLARKLGYPSYGRIWEEHTPHIAVEDAMCEARIIMSLLGHFTP